MGATSVRERLDPSVFNLPVERVRDGYYSDAYFTFSKEVLEAEDHRPPVTMQVFQKKAALLETVYLGCMARRTLVMRNVREVVEAAAGKPILFFPARHDHWLVQTGDGWAAHVAGAIGVSTDAQASWWGGGGGGAPPPRPIP